MAGIGFLAIVLRGAMQHRVAVAALPPRFGLL